MDYNNLDKTVEDFFKSLISNATVYYGDIDENGNHIIITNKPVELKKDNEVKETPIKNNILYRKEDSAVQPIVELQKQLEEAKALLRQKEIQEKNRLEQINQSKIRYENLCETLGEQISDLYCSWLDLIEELKFEKEPFVKNINDSLDTIVDEMKESYN